MADRLKEVTEKLLSEGYTVCIVGDDSAYHSFEHGIAPLLSLVGTDAFRGAYAADRIVGKAAAMLYVVLGVKAVYADVLSEGGRAVFETYGIGYAFGTLTDAIINRAGTGLCPMELAVRDIDDPAAAPAALREKLAQLSNSR